MSYASYDSNSGEVKPAYDLYILPLLFVENDIHGHTMQSKEYDMSLICEGQVLWLARLLLQGLKVSNSS